ncbi:hypothetical protein LG943_04485 [Streptomonospora sp. S1-112]|uniref:Uncharacterized protein n=1 Tax=Streptomonospora mangrovi TaxID=2883123 RepID=A0A9X3SLR0_9ACTN|nr:hypothetical protein [Streptomonospora mangrovi]MDA0563591.1 hypothetical protein [Streptomonospora mangrovi]
MVLGVRKRRVRPVLAGCRPVGDALLRLGVLSGIAAAGWLLGSVAAAADDLPGPGLASVSEITDSAPVQQVGAAIARDHAESAQAEAAAQTSGSAPAPATSAEGGPVGGGAAEGAGTAARGGGSGPLGGPLPSAVGAALSEAENASGGSERGGRLPVLDTVARTGEAAGAGARDVVQRAARGTGEVLTGTVEAGSRVGGFADRSLRDSRLTGPVHQSLTGETARLNDRLGQAVGTAPRVDLGAVGATLFPPADPPAALGAERPAHPEAREATDKPDARPASARPAPVDPADLRFGYVADTAAAARSADTAAAARSADSAGGAAPVDTPAWPDTSDSTGAVSSSPFPAAPAGFLMTRAHALGLIAQRVALPDDPSVVVRYTADDPSFSPD